MLSPVSISPNFPPDSHNPHTILFLSNDSVLFHIHTNIIRQVSDLAFQSILAQPNVLIHGHSGDIKRVPEDSEGLDIILHALYRIPYSDQAPQFQTLMDAISTMRRYGIEPSLHLTPSNPFYVSLLGFAPLAPLELYALAAQFDIYPLAAAASSHLLSRPLTSISDDMAMKIGAVYLKRLMALHLERMDSLKEILIFPPVSYQPTETCNIIDQRKLTSAWAMTAANFAWNARPDLSTSLIRSSFSALKESITCDGCQIALDDRLHDVVTRWAAVKYTI